VNRSKIILCDDIEYAKTEVVSHLDTPLVKTFFEDEFKVEDAHAVIKEAYIAEEREKALVLAASAYNIYAQNALLKLLEEPPRNIRFIIISRSKNALLPTVRSRMQIETLTAEKVEVDLGLDPAKMDLADIFTFIKRHQNSKKEETKTLIALLLKESVVESGIPLSESELSLFDTALELAELNARPQNLFSMLLLTIYEARMKR
jgi:DNA polymerase-3 subunit delta'